MFLDEQNSSLYRKMKASKIRALKMQICKNSFKICTVCTRRWLPHKLIHLIGKLSNQVEECLPTVNNLTQPSISLGHCPFLILYSHIHTNGNEIFQLCPKRSTPLDVCVIPRTLSVRWRYIKSARRRADWAEFHFHLFLRLVIIISF